MKTPELFRDIITKFSTHHSMVKRKTKFENGYIVMGRWYVS